ncbi:hypothetical protein REB14_02355 [Chryseobacterium sp. ES2]|uniref:Uncharacterized protein n=1 Tax=Chryseobacterium metallicongregator TaxID=3073042 RepID=A0ABU1DZP0_9FLAO|nr:MULTISPECIES: hypothetical protein [Chryseobacterium]MDR4951023.1 hypothetical protein [Chryseobacterium sp. ES2]
MSRIRKKLPYDASIQITNVRSRYINLSINSIF